VSGASTRRRLTGRLLRLDLGPGVIVLEAADGSRWSLDGQVDPALIGRMVEVEGDEDSGAFGFSMVGPTLQLRSIRAR
jgi:hypothetical protein